MITRFDKGVVYSSVQLAGLYDDLGPLCGPLKMRGGVYLLVQFTFGRVVQNDCTAKMRLDMQIEGNLIGSFEAEAKFFTNIQSLRGFNWLGLAIANIASDSFHPKAEHAKFVIRSLLLTDEVSDDVRDMKYFQ